jgi:GTP-binding protein
MKSNFVDYVKIYFTSGAGGPGAVSWRREKFVPQGGPDGGDGGKGGSIILKGNKQLWTLLDLKYRKFIKAESGEKGKGKKMNGRSGKDEILEVPVGVVIKNADTNEILGEITEDGEELTLLPGGRGGLGNWHFRSATNQIPEYAQPGEPAKELCAIIELKLLADVGLVGFPNAGKSTLLSVLTAAKPEIADYPFTTLVPNLGIVKFREFHSFVMADIPGIIEGASEGKGLGSVFLRHIERNSVLLFLVSATSENIEQEYQILCNELEAYEPELIHKKRVVALTKSDLLTPKEEKELAEKFPDFIIISSVANKNLDKLLDALWAQMNEDD